MAKDNIVLYGTGWCTKTAMLSNFMQSEGFEFEFKNVETDEQANKDVRAIYDGKLKYPTITKGANHIKNPTISELLEFLKQ